MTKIVETTGRSILIDNNGISMRYERVSNFYKTKIGYWCNICDLYDNINKSCRIPDDNILECNQGRSYHFSLISNIKIPDLNKIINEVYCREYCPNCNCNSDVISEFSDIKFCPKVDIIRSALKTPLKP